MEPLRGGALTANLPEAITDSFAESGLRHSPAEWALKWLFDDPRISVVLSGMSAMEHVTENLRISAAAGAGSLTDKERKVMNQVQAIFRQRMKVPCTTCGYCMPCPAGVEIPKNFSMYNSFHMMGEKFHDATRFMYFAQVAETARAAKCVKCGRCETHCPQHIAIMRELENVAATFK